ncbi:VCBS repeat-containing protein [Confluentibacter flavum]|uniref:ASPIC/UnbV domain-containing protein n=1 Tax=Confluentibacter flavum TaxID=1909700 RepID=A0A2N3HNN6_9FLAO|nr:VCBS repeat-containing protein [Confluentibacter flavum]PKQ46593.1 hypothetical protein CSW08_02205 [Confluentibacter flavum]
MNKFTLNIVLMVLFFGCKKDSGYLFKILPEKTTGITFSNTLKDTTDQNILDYLYYYNGGGVAVGDINNDGFVDIFFISNQSRNKLYINKGNLKFEDISSKAGIEGNSTWNTGVTMADVNGDGLLDIYVCAVVGTNGFIGHNELYINNGNETFTEVSAAYGLDIDNYSSNATFFDYDLDGDLDMFLLNHAIHTQESFGKADIRNKRNYESGDKLFRNDNNHFTDVSEEAGIFGGPNGYGLGIAISDFNRDGFPDIYISNDFHEDDYYYLNNGNGTFTEALKQYFGHVSKFSMGSDAADVNNDGFTDLLTLDMLPEDETILKSSIGDDDIQIQELRTSVYGYNYQYARNMLQLNQSGSSFTETALLSGIAASDWSWGALISDYDQDGLQDVFITNGIPKRPNDLDYVKYISNNQIKKKLKSTNLIDQEALKYMPEGKLNNAFYKGTPNLEFINQTKEFASQEATFSTGLSYADLDNDGDLDLITNNINAPASIYINSTNAKKNYLKIQFKFSKKNKLGIGTKVFVYANGTMQYKELFTQRGFQSASQPIIHFGLDTLKTIDSIKVIWPNNKYQVLRKVAVNKSLTVEFNNEAQDFNYSSLHENKHIDFEQVKNNLGINYKHKENKYTDSNRSKLIPYQISDRGPALAVGDLNNDGKDDVFLGSSKYFDSEIYIQEDSLFVKKEFPVLKKDAITESVSAIISDFNNDKSNDLFVASGGGEFFGKAQPLSNKLYRVLDNDLIKLQLPENFEDTAVIKAIDYDSDGDLDVFVGNATISNNFGSIPESYILINNQGSFTKKSLGKLGMVRDAVWTDFNNDKQLDLLIVGEWMQPTFLQNNGGKFVDKTSTYIKQSLEGLYRAVIPFDVDSDGDLDYLLGNWGTNTKFKATETYPMLMYYSDFDKNTKTETIVATHKNDNYYTLEGLDELSSELVSLTKKKFTTYKDFAGKPINKVFDAELLEKAKLFKVYNLASGILKNNQGTFSFIPFDNRLQVAPINCFAKIKKENKEQVLCAGNYFGIKPYHGRFDGFAGALITNENNIALGHGLGLNFFNKAVSKLQTITINNKQYLIAVIHNGNVQVYNIK